MYYRGYKTFSDNIIFVHNLRTLQCVERQSDDFQDIKKKYIYIYIKRRERHSMNDQMNELERKKKEKKKEGRRN